MVAPQEEVLFGAQAATSTNRQSGAAVRSKPCAMSSSRSRSSAAACSSGDSALQSSSRHGSSTSLEHHLQRARQAVPEERRPEHVVTGDNLPPRLAQRGARRRPLRARS